MKETARMENAQIGRVWTVIVDGEGDMRNGLVMRRKGKQRRKGEQWRGIMTERRK